MEFLAGRLSKTIAVVIRGLAFWAVPSLLRGSVPLLFSNDHGSFVMSKNLESSKKEICDLLGVADCPLQYEDALKVAVRVAKCSPAVQLVLLGIGQLNLPAEVVAADAPVVAPVATPVVAPVVESVLEIGPIEPTIVPVVAEPVVEPVVEPVAEVVVDKPAKKAKAKKPAKPAEETAAE